MAVRSASRPKYYIKIKAQFRVYTWILRIILIIIIIILTSGTDEWPRQLLRLVGRTKIYNRAASSRIFLLRDVPGIYNITSLRWRYKSTSLGLGAKLLRLTARSWLPLSRILCLAPRLVPLNGGTTAAV
jgi:hypothetical protein